MLDLYDTVCVDLDCCIVEILAYVFYSMKNYPGEIIHMRKTGLATYS